MKLIFFILILLSTQVCFSGSSASTSNPSSAAKRCVMRYSYSFSGGNLKTLYQYWDNKDYGACWDIHKRKPKVTIEDIPLSKFHANATKNNTTFCGQCTWNNGSSKAKYMDIT